MDYVQLSQTLAESFNALADEVQTLADLKTVLEHKLRFAHEQVCIFYLMDICATSTLFSTLFHIVNAATVLATFGSHIGKKGPISLDKMMSYLSSRS